MAQDAGKPLMLIIMDGLGIGDGGENDAVAQARTPVLDRLIREATLRGKYTKLRTDGEFVGLPEGQMGNSDVGHGTAGSGRISYELLRRISVEIKNTNLFQNQELLTLLEQLKSSGGKFHITALLSDGGVHSHIEHAIAMANFVADQGVPVVIHASVDGRDVDPKSALRYLEQFETFTAGRNVTIATVTGRAYSMERTDNQKAIKLAYDAVIFGKGRYTDSIAMAINQDYAEQFASSGMLETVNDQDVKPIIVGNYQGIGANDAIFTMNFRADRAIRFCQALLQPEKWNVERKFGLSGSPQFPKSRLFAITEYADDLNPHMTVLLDRAKIKNGLSEVVSNAGLSQLRVAEKEKGAHVTFFFNGANQLPFPGEEWVILPSPIVQYDQKPEMSSVEVTDTVIEKNKAKPYDLTVVNYANPDMVGHTGNFDAVVKSVEAVDMAIGRLVAELETHEFIIIGDHGNAEKMREANGDPHTKHTTNPVHMLLVSGDRAIRLSPFARHNEPGLADIAPTILGLLGLDKPKEMTGQAIYNVANRKLGTVIGDLQIN